MTVSIEERHQISATEKVGVLDLVGVDERSFLAAVRSLAGRFPAHPVTEITVELQRSLRETADAPVQIYRLVLAERRTRDRLSAVT